MTTATPELAFAGFRLLAAAADDPVLAKWRGVRTQLACGPLRDAALSPGADMGAWNAHVNAAIRYQAEAPGVDVWQTPAVTLAQLTGDCEDFAILKYALLAASGVSEPCLRIVVGQIKSIAGNQDHAWLAFFHDGDLACTRLQVRFHHCRHRLSQLAADGGRARGHRRDLRP